MLKGYLSRLRRVLTVRGRYQDHTSLKEMEKQQKILEAMLAAARNEDVNGYEADSK